MAAKLPKPPGNFLKSLLNQHNTNKNQQQQQLQQQNNNEDDDNKEGNGNKELFTTKTTTDSTDSNTTAAIAATKKTNCNCSNISIMHLFHEMKQEFPTIPDTIVAQCVNENCHQRENCIQMLKNELELNPIPAQSYPAKVLHPPNINNNILQNSTNGNNTARPPLQQKPLVVQQKPPLKPIKPIRTAPLQPPNQQQNYNNNNDNNAKINSTSTTQMTASTTATANKLGCGGGDGGTNFANNDNVVVVEEGNKKIVDVNDKATKITPHHTPRTSTNTANSTQAEVCNNDKIAFAGCIESNEKNLPRQRPTTLNLNTQFREQQQQQRQQRLNIQLQQRFQEQRNRQQQQNATTLTTKPMRKAPLPPIAPKPSQFQSIKNTNANAINNFLNNSLATNHTATSPLSESEISVSVSLSTPSPSSSSSSPNTTIHHSFNKPTQTKTTHQQHLQTKSPIRHRSVINLQPEPPYTRDFLLSPASHASSTPSSPSLAAVTPTTTKQTTATNSSSSANSSPTASIAGSQKSFTSVNLTLRPPITPNGANSALQPSTIDITAGPGFSGASGGGGGGKSLHYSSTSYDARLGYQQNFQITVTDECGVFSASRIRPQYNHLQQQQQQQQQQQRCLNQVNIQKENQNNNTTDKETTAYHNNNYFNSLLNAQHQQQQQQQQHLHLQQHQQFHNNNVVALQQNIQNSIQSPQTSGPTNTSSGFGGSGDCVAGSLTQLSGNMCFSPQQTMDASTQEILQRQKKKRDKLAAALREYKKRLGNVEQEINLLTGTIPTEGLSERLDEEIIKLRRDCQEMLRSSNTFTQPAAQQELAINYQPHQQQMYQQQQSQPFPRQGTTRAPPTPHQTSLDIIQHHSQTSTPYTQPAASLPNLNAYNFSQQQQQQQSQNHLNFSSLTSPPFYQQQQQQQQLAATVNANFGSNHNNNVLYTDPQNNYGEEDLVKDDDDYEEYEEVIEPWECNMCTFRNHPQLNICETCENVRIIPGRLTNLSRMFSTSSNAINATTINTTNTVAATTGIATTASNVSPTPLGLLRGTGSHNSINNNNSNNSSSNSNSNNNILNAANGNLEHDTTNLVQQQLQHFALHI